MGLWISRLLNLFGDQEARILVLGLDNAGKTTILCAFSFLGRRRVFARARARAPAADAAAVLRASSAHPSLRLSLRPPLP
jgi:hypothetical protein